MKLERIAGASMDWINPDDPLEAILRTAALVCAADVVVAADTMVAHLAGALGRPVCLLVEQRAGLAVDGRAAGRSVVSAYAAVSAAGGRFVGGAA